MFVCVCLLGSNLNVCAKLEKTWAIKRCNCHLSSSPDG
jgi:hypothetical protein